MKSLVTPYFNHIGFVEQPTDQHLRILSRSNSVNWACRLGVQECLQNATNQFNSWLTSSIAIEYYHKT